MSTGEPRGVPTPPENLIVEFVVPHYFPSLFAAQYPDEHGGIGAQVFLHEYGEYVGDVTFIENDDGEWIINVEDPEQNVIMRTHIENVSRIVVL